MTMGLTKYLLFIAIPSPIKNGDYTPWELSASLLGGSNLGVGASTAQKQQDAMRYYDFACSNDPFLWLHDLYTYIKSLFTV